jgi:hypothetical protein
MDFRDTCLYGVVEMDLVCHIFLKPLKHLYKACCVPSAQHNIRHVLPKDTFGKESYIRYPPVPEHVLTMDGFIRLCEPWTRMKTTDGGKAVTTLRDVKLSFVESAPVSVDEMTSNIHTCLPCHGLYFEALARVAHRGTVLGSWRVFVDVAGKTPQV